MSATLPPRSPAPPAVPLRFGRYALRPDARELLADGMPVPIGGRAFDLLAYLVRHADRAVASDELQRAVWPGRDVGANNVRVQITALRKLLGEGVIAHHATHGYRLVPPVLDDRDPPDTDAPAPGNLPAHLPPLLGRDDELQRLQALLAQHARVTLAGPAGVGKTALARAAAHARRLEHADGVWWVELAGMTEATQLAGTVAALLQVKLAGQAPAEELARALAGRDLLLVLDNCEHLVRPACDLADALLRHAPTVGVLSTSRRSLKSAGEQLHRLEPLGLPVGQGLQQARRSGAVALFEARARRADPGFALTRDNIDIVCEICRQLDGVAMAIGLAAARVPLLGVAGLRDLLGERLRLLSSRETDPRGHPQALNTALDWSHELLSPGEQAVLRRLGVFAGSFGLLSVQALATDTRLDEWAVLEALNALIDHSLLNSDSGALQAGAPARYSLHESVRLYARTHLEASGEWPALRERHARHLFELVTGAVRPPGVPPPRDRMDLQLPDADLDNLRAAQAWANAHDIALALDLATRSSAFHRLRGHHLEARRLGQQLVDDPRSAGHGLQRGRMRLAMAPLCLELNDTDEVLRLARAAIEDLTPSQDPGALGDAWSWIGSAHLMRREPAAAEPALRRSLELDRLAGNVAGEASQMNNLALMLAELERHDEARQMLQDALGLNRRIGNRWGTAITLENIGEVAYAMGDLAAAQAGWEASLPLIRDIGHRYHEALLMLYFALVARRQARPAEAAAYVKACLAIASPQRMSGLVADALVVQAGLVLDAGRPRQAAVLLSAAELQRGNTPPSGPIVRDVGPITWAARGALSDAQWQAARVEGRGLSPEEAAAAAA